MIEQMQIEQTDHVSKDLPMHRLTLLDPLGMMLAAVVFFGVSYGAAFVVMKTDWNLVAKLYAGANGLFFALLGVVALARALRDIASRFTTEFRSRVLPVSSRERLRS